MASTFRLSVVAPDRTVVEQDVLSLIVPGVEGYLGMQAGHQPMIVALKTGLLEFRDAQTQQHFVAVSGGFVEVDAHKVIVIADSAQRAQDIDIKEAEMALERARKALRGEDSTMSTEEAAAELERAMNRIKTARLKS